jgi:hypothetical protein
MSSSWADLHFPYVPDTQERAIRALLAGAWSRAKEIRAIHESAHDGIHAVVRTTAALMDVTVEAHAVQAHSRSAQSALHGDALRILATPSGDIEAVHRARMRAASASERLRRAQETAARPCRGDRAVCVELSWREGVAVEDARAFLRDAEKALARVMRRVYAPTKRQSRRRAIHRAIALRNA